MTQLIDILSRNLIQPLHTQLSWKLPTSISFDKLIIQQSYRIQQHLKSIFNLQKNNNRHTSLSYTFNKKFLFNNQSKTNQNKNKKGKDQFNQKKQKLIFHIADVKIQIWKQISEQTSKLESCQIHNTKSQFNSGLNKCSKPKIWKNSLRQIRKTYKFKKDLKIKKQYHQENSQMLITSMILLENSKNIFSSQQKIPQSTIQNQISNIQNNRILFSLESVMSCSKAKNHIKQTHQNIFTSEVYTSENSEKFQQLSNFKHFYISINQNLPFFSLRCHFLDKMFNLIKITNLHQKIEFLNKQVSLFQFNKINDSSYGINNIRMKEWLFKLDFQKGQIFIQLKFLSNSLICNIFQLLFQFSQIINNSREKIFDCLNFVINGENNCKFSDPNDELKITSLQNQLRVILKANIQEPMGWLQKKIRQNKAIQKKKQEQQHLTYAFSNKIFEYEIMQDPFLKQGQKAIEMKKLKQAQIAQQNKQSITTSQGARYQEIMCPKKMKEQLFYSNILRNIKMELLKHDKFISKSFIRQNNHQISVDTNRKRSVSTSLPLISIQRESNNKVSDLLNDVNLRIIKDQINKIISKNYFSRQARQQNYENIKSTVKLICRNPQKYYTFQLISIQEIQQNLQVNQIFSQFQNSKSHLQDKYGSFTPYLFDYKNYEIYQSWIKFKQPLKQQKLNFDFSPSTQLFYSQKELPNGIFFRYESDFQICINQNNQRKKQPQSLILINSSQNKIYKDHLNEQQASNQEKNRTVFSAISDFSFQQNKESYSQKQRKILKINMAIFPQKLIFNFDKVLSIKTAPRVISLQQYIIKNQNILRFNKKLSIFKQIIEFSYLLQYFSLEKQICFDIQHIFITKSITIKIDCKYTHTSFKKNKTQSIFFTLIKIFLQIFFQRKCYNKRKFDKSKKPQEEIFFCQEDNLKYIKTLKNSQMKAQSHSQINQEIQEQNQKVIKQTRYDEAELQNFIQFKRFLEQSAFSVFSQKQCLRNYGQKRALKLIWQLLYKYASSVQYEVQTFYYEKYNVFWLFLLLQKLQELISSKNL